ncbi:hypothetical protein BGX27_004251 [Mortierella sp. AM989]|nr:hypothetical protein BGX27_004251 [Mortierella sp. AM989]
MEDAAQVIGEALPELAAQTKNPTLANPPQFLIDILAPLKEKALNGAGDVDSNRLCLHVEREIGGMADKVLSGIKTDEREAMVLKILHVVYYTTPKGHRAKVTKYMGEDPGDTFCKNKDIRCNFLYWLRLLRGETGLEESKTQREVNESAHAACPTNTPVYPRKWEFKTVSNFELKPLQATSQQVEVQVRYSAHLYCIWEHESIHVCGKVTDEGLAIPTSDPELEWFLDGRCLAALMSLKAHLLDIAQQVQHEHARPKQAPEAPEHLLTAL